MLKSNNGFLAWVCSYCQSGPSCVIFQCSYCNLKLCRECSQNV